MNILQRNATLTVGPPCFRSPFAYIHREFFDDDYGGFYGYGYYGGYGYYDDMSGIAYGDDFFLGAVCEVALARLPPSISLFPSACPPPGSVLQHRAKKAEKSKVAEPFGGKIRNAIAT